MLRCGANCFDCTAEMRRIRGHSCRFEEIFHSAEEMKQLRKQRDMTPHFSEEALRKMKKEKSCYKKAHSGTTNFALCQACIKQDICETEYWYS